MKHYFLSKLSNINRKIALHPGNANERLASQSEFILAQLHISMVPKCFKKKFSELISLIDKTFEQSERLGRRKTFLRPVKLETIQNRTATKYIELLLKIQEEFDNELSA